MTAVADHQLLYSEHALDRMLDWSISEESGITRPGHGDKALTHDGTTVVVQHVPAEVCDTCGERFFGSAVVRELLQIARDAAAAGVVVDVRRYPAAA